MHPAADRWVQNTLIVALLGSAFAVDPFAHAGFEAPKRLIAMISAVFGASVLVISSAPPHWRVWSRTAKLCLASVLFATAWILLSNLFSPHGFQAWANLRTVAVFFLFAILGAAHSHTASTRAVLTWVVILTIGINAGLSLLQAAGLDLPIHIKLIGGRFPTGALLGNEGYIALTCAFLGSGCVAFLFRTNNHSHRTGAALLLVLSVCTILVNQQRTSLIAWLASGMALLAIRWRAAWLIGLCANVIIFCAISAMAPALRTQTWARTPMQNFDTYQNLTTYRLSAWASANEMIRQRPLLGYGLGSFELESTQQRMQAEIRLGARLKTPPNTNVFTSAHNEYLQFAAEAGIPVLIAMMAGFGILITGMARICLASNDPEAGSLFTILITGAVAALAWFPMQIPFTAILLLLACGRAWRLIADRCGDPDS